MAIQKKLENVGLDTEDKQKFQYEQIHVFLKQAQDLKGNSKQEKQKIVLYNKAYKLLVKALKRNNQIVLTNLKDFGDLPKYNGLYGKNLFFYVIQSNAQVWAEKLLENNQIDRLGVTTFGYNYIQMAVVYRKIKLLRFIVKNALCEDLTFRNDYTKKRDMPFANYINGKYGAVFNSLKQAEIILEKHQLNNSLINSGLEKNSVKLL